MRIRMGGVRVYVCEKVVAYSLKPADQWTPRLKPHREQRAGEELGVLSQ